MYEETAAFIRNLYPGKDPVPLHEPFFGGNEKAYVNDCIDSTFVSSVGQYVDRFERMIGETTGAKFAVATVNGTAALHAALRVGGVEANDEVLTQSLTFVATANAIAYCNTLPVFIDSDRQRLGLSAEKLADFLQTQTVMKQDGFCYNRRSGRRIRACVPMHVFGHPVQIDRICDLCAERNIIVVEDAAEALGSLYKGKACGTFGKLGIFSFNGNKTITTGGGGMIVTDDPKLARRAKHLTTTAKQSHSWEYEHDAIGFNYRLPNLNAALGCAQMEQLDRILREKRLLADTYRNFFEDRPETFVTEPDDSSANYWLNTLLLPNAQAKARFLQALNRKGILCRPAWKPMHLQSIYSRCEHDGAANAVWLYERIVNLPSSAGARCNPSS